MLVNAVNGLEAAVLLIVSIRRSKFQESALGDGISPANKIRWSRVIPWFIIGFIALSLARSSGHIPRAWLNPINEVSMVLTIVSTAALGLGVDVRIVACAGTRVILAVTGSLILIAAIAMGMIRFSGLH